MGLRNDGSRNLLRRYLLKFRTESWTFSLKNKWTCITPRSQRRLQWRLSVAKLFTTLPVTTATTERIQLSFYNIQKIKCVPWEKTSSTVLHWKAYISVEDVLSQYNKSKPRRKCLIESMFNIIMNSPSYECQNVIIT